MRGYLEPTAIYGRKIDHYYRRQPNSNEDKV